MFTQRVLPAFRAVVCGALLALGLSSASVWAAAPYSNIFVFGDSLSDSGNVYLATSFLTPAAPPYSPGRFSNGLNYADLMSVQLRGEPLNPSLAGGTNYAWGGAFTGTDGLVPNMVKQSTDYADATGGQADPNALYVVWGGANDVFAAIGATAVDPLMGFQVGQATVDESTANLQIILGDLAEHGARNILVANLPDLGLTPRGRSHGAGIAGYASFISLAFDTQLDEILDGLAASYDGLNLHRLDVYSLLNDVVAHPGAYGLSNVHDSCYTGGLTGGGSVCADPNSYLFWDDLHPTAAAHQVLAQGALAALVPEPQVWALMLAGLVLVSLAVQRRGLASQA